MRYLLDTNICIYLIKRKPPSVIERLSTLAIEEVAISSITIAELQYGIYKSQYPERNRTALLEFLLPFALLDFDQDAAREYGMVRTQVESQGTPIGAMDMLIAAHARSQSLIMVTNNVQEFQRVEDLTVENWSS